MLNRNLTLVADTKKITPSQLTKVAVAWQKQATPGDITLSRYYTSEERRGFHGPKYLRSNRRSL